MGGMSDRGVPWGRPPSCPSCPTSATVHGRRGGPADPNGPIPTSFCRGMFPLRAIGSFLYTFREKLLPRKSWLPPTLPQATPIGVFMHRDLSLFSRPPLVSPHCDPGSVPTVGIPLCGIPTPASPVSPNAARSHEHGPRLRGQRPRAPVLPDRAPADGGWILFPA